MKEEDNNIFDLQIRNLLESATEEVPEGVWRGIESRLDAVRATVSEGAESGVSGRKVHRLPLWLKVAGGVAAAAALAVGVFLGGGFSDGQSEDLMAETPEEMVAEPIVESASEPVADEGHTADIKEVNGAGITTGNANRREISVAEAGAGRELLAETSVEIVSDSSAGTDTYNNIVDSQVKETRAEEVVSEETAVSEDEEEIDVDSDEAAWAEILREEEDRGDIRAAITLSGNAISNSNSSVSKSISPIYFAPSLDGQKQDVISQSSESSYSIPMSFGVGAKVGFTKRFSASIGVNYSLLRRSFAGTYFDIQEDGSYTEHQISNIVNRLDYIGIPLNVYFSILQGKFIDFYAYAGGTAEKCVSNKYKLSGEFGDIYHSEAVKGMEFSVNAGIGVEFIIADIFGIYIDPSLRYYFPNKNQPQSIRTVQPLMFGVELGFRFHL